MDEQLRTLEREAFSGNPQAVQQLMVYKIGRLQMELPIEPTMLSSLETGRYVGQTVHEKDGMQHPCFKWENGWQIKYIDMASGRHVHTEQTRAATMCCPSHSMDALRYATFASSPNISTFRDNPPVFDLGLDRAPEFHAAVHERAIEMTQGVRAQFDAIMRNLVIRESMKTPSFVLNRLPDGNLEIQDTEEQIDLSP